MTTHSRAFPTVKATLVLAIACLCCALTVAVPMAQGAISYEKESLSEYEQQLAGGQIGAVTINKFIRSLRITLKDGRHVLATYPKHEEAAVAGKLKEKGVPVTVLTPEAAQKEAKSKPVKHKLRYIAGGVLIVVILIVGGVLLVFRRRRLAAE
ncbi:MAG TPA: hypothetical protein VN892_16160 [Solirubrobacteraceae bacterium]|nr:hypothetical protein [Solirubrobacteraceae bacterium]